MAEQEMNVRLLAALKRMLAAFEGWGDTTSPACIEARAAVSEAEAALKVSR